MSSNLPTYLPLNEAAKQYEISVDTLKAALEQNNLKAIQLPDGGILIAVEDVQVLAEQLQPQPVLPELSGQPIRAADAANKYQVSTSNLVNWVSAGYINILERGPKLLLLDEGDVQRVAGLFHRARQETGSYVRAGWVLKRTLAITLPANFSE